jgi:hypothetical protein
MRQNKGDPNKDSRFRDGRWYCDYGGCGKSYLGFKEMLRHGLNHTKPEYKCKYCWREWHRNDVYLQHFERKPDWWVFFSMLFFISSSACQWTGTLTAEIFIFSSYSLSQ